jgi:hypothetical protein
MMQGIPLMFIIALAGFMVIDYVRVRVTDSQSTAPRVQSLQ